MIIKEYISTVNQKYRAGNATEHTYRGALEQLMQTLLTKLRIVNEPKREKCGAPDYIASRKDGMPVFYIEAKNIGDNDLDGRNAHGHKEQFTRYKQALDYIIFTDYLDFHFYEHGEFIDSVRIAEIKGDKIVAVSENEDKFMNLINHFGNTAIQSITSASRLAKLMAGKARLLENIIEQAMNDEADSYANENLRGQYQAFKDVLIQELKPSEFADIYAQTIAYGMFAARLHDDTPEDFSREEAARLIPKTNPFLRQIFNNLAGNDLDERIAWVVDDLAMVFRATDIQKIMTTYVQDKRHHDPMIHFYEDFLSEYNPKLRKSKGVWYTPQPVVGFIVRAVDEILQREFGLAEGLADYSMIEKEVAVEQSRDKRTSDGAKHEMHKFHRVQILDPATGTGTFLAEVVNQIYDRYRDNQGIWQQYVEQHLLPRLNGFEILMASYAVAHIKLDMLLSETGYQHNTDKRLHVYLTNSLEESNNEPRTLFAQWLSREATEANIIKRNYPIMVMIGNPPYSGVSQNNGKWITKLIDDYKKEPGGNIKLQERKNWLNDDYVKFIRLAEDYVSKNQTGIVGFINNNAFTDNLTFRGMRWHLLKTFDKIYIINLHGCHQIGRTDVCPNGMPDENVFDITLGVSINIFVKTGEKAKEELGKVYYCGIYGDRQTKYDWLNMSNLHATDFQEITPIAPYYFFVDKSASGKEQYEEGFSISDLIPNNVSGIVTMGDNFAIANNKEELKARLQYVKSETLSNEQLNEKYSLGKNYADFILSGIRQLAIKDELFIPLSFRPFDERITYFSEKVIWRPRKKVMSHMLRDNIALVVCRQCNDDWKHIFITNKVSDFNLTGTAGRFGSGYVFPLYVYSENMGVEERIPNFNTKLLSQIEQSLGEQIEPIELFDYIYAVLHSPNYRERYKEFLKIDFPRIPYPTNADEYHRLAKLGAELRKLHLMEDLPTQLPTLFPKGGTLQVDCLRWEQNRVYINSEQYFENVPESAWNFYIGGYQPAQKWLKDRKGMTLDIKDVKHYQSIIYVLQQTARIMQEIDA